MKILWEKHTDNGIELDGGCPSNNTGVLNSFDGAQHLNREEGVTSVMSYSSSCFSRESIVSGIGAAASDQILTWQQCMGKENA